MATRHLARMKKKNATRDGAIAVRAAKYAKWLVIAFLVTLVVGIGLHLAGLLPPGMARFILSAE